MGEKSAIDYLIEFKKITELEKIRNAKEREAKARELHYKKREREKRIERRDKIRREQEAEDEVNSYQEKIELVLGLHKYIETEFNWEDYFENPPQKPKNPRDFERGAREELVITHFTIWDKLTGGDKKYRTNKINEAIKQDEELYLPELREYEIKYKEWSEIKAIGEEVIKGNLESYFTFIKKCNPLDVFLSFVESFKIIQITQNLIEIDINVFDENIVPKEEKLLSRTGRVVEKPINKKLIYPMYVNYICGSSLRVARELFIMFPISQVIIHTNKKIVDSSTGNKRFITIQSIFIHKNIVDKMNFELLDPVDSMKHFPHRAGIKAEGCFSSIVKITLDDVRKCYDKIKNG